MTPIQERHQLVELIEEAVRSGARKSRACSEARVCVRTLQRWQIDSGKVKEDARSKAFHKAFLHMRAKSATVGGAEYARCP